jgi:hypothetical protein
MCEDRTDMLITFDMCGVLFSSPMSDIYATTINAVK